MSKSAQYSTHKKKCHRILAKYQVGVVYRSLVIDLLLMNLTDGKKDGKVGLNMVQDTYICYIYTMNINKYSILFDSII